MSLLQNALVSGKRYSFEDAGNGIHFILHNMRRCHYPIRGKFQSDFQEIRKNDIKLKCSEFGFKKVSHLHESNLIE